MNSQKALFKSEADLCRTFIGRLPPEWIAYPETAGFDILLSRKEDGAQIGIEAKLTLNAKVILQACPSTASHSDREMSPDFRAVLVPYGYAPPEMCKIAWRLGITTIQMKTKEVYQALRFSSYPGFVTRFRNPHVFAFEPSLPMAGETDYQHHWIDLAPWSRFVLPAYVPDVAAGASAPLQLSEWKIKAIKIAIILERRGWVCIPDFIHLKLNRQFFMTQGWIKPESGVERARGKYVAGVAMGMKRLHPRNYAEIEADFEIWKPPEPPEKLTQEDLL